MSGSPEEEEVAAMFVGNALLLGIGRLFFFFCIRGNMHGDQVEMEANKWWSL